jgi:hypothetical protein
MIVPSDYPSAAELRQLIDEARIRDVYVRYARGVDRLDRELLLSCFHSGQTIRHGMDADALVDYLLTTASQHLANTHMMGQQWVEVEGDVAWTEVYHLATALFPSENDKPEGTRFVSARYCDRLERREGQWRIAAREVAFDTQVLVERGDRPEEFAAGSYSDGTPKPRGKHDRSDPSYQRP